MSHEETLEILEVFGKQVIPEFDKDPVHSTTRYRESATPKHPTRPPPPELKSIWSEGAYRGVMTLIEERPVAIHIGADDLPWVDIGDGSKLKVLQVKATEGLWIVQNIFQAGYTVPTHRHTGPVWGYTISGAWHYKEYDYVNRAGSFLYEPAAPSTPWSASRTTPTCGSRCTAPTSTSTPRATSRASSTGPGTLAAYYALCEAAGLPKPNVVTA